MVSHVLPPFKANLQTHGSASGKFRPQEDWMGQTASSFLAFILGVSGFLLIFKVLQNCRLGRPSVPKGSSALRPTQRRQALFRPTLMPRCCRQAQLRHEALGNHCKAALDKSRILHRVCLALPSSTSRLNMAPSSTATLRPTCATSVSPWRCCFLLSLLGGTCLCFTIPDERATTPATQTMEANRVWTEMGAIRTWPEPYTTPNQEHFELSESGGPELTQEKSMPHDLGTATLVFEQKASHDMVTASSDTSVHGDGSTERLFSTTLQTPGSKHRPQRSSIDPEPNIKVSGVTDVHTSTLKHRAPRSSTDLGPNAEVTGITDLYTSTLKHRAQRSTANPELQREVRGATGLQTPTLEHRDRRSTTDPEYTEVDGTAGLQTSKPLRDTETTRLHPFSVPKLRLSPNSTGFTASVRVQDFHDFPNPKLVASRSKLTPPEPKLDVNLAEEGGVLVVSWTFQAGGPAGKLVGQPDSQVNTSLPVDAFIVSFHEVTEMNSESESSRLAADVRRFVLRELDPNKDHIVCVHAFSGSVEIKHACTTWERSSLKVLVGVLVGTLFLVPCIIVMTFIYIKDRQMRARLARELREGSRTALVIKNRSCHNHVDHGQTYNQHKHSCGSDLQRTSTINVDVHGSGSDKLDGLLANQNQHQNTGCQQHNSLQLSTNICVDDQAMGVREGNVVGVSVSGVNTVARADGVDSVGRDDTGGVNRVTCGGGKGSAHETNGDDGAGDVIPLSLNRQSSPKSGPVTQTSPVKDSDPGDPTSLL